jgi:hypothetical protein
MEMCSGGNLYEFVKIKGAVKEAQARVIVR